MAAKRQKNRIEAEMTKRWIAVVLLVHRGEALHRCEDPPHSNKPEDQRLVGLGYAAVKQPSPLHSQVPFPKRELVEP